jgi:hypothetical protein
VTSNSSGIVLKNAVKPAMSSQRVSAQRKSPCCWNPKCLCSAGKGSRKKALVDAGVGTVIDVREYAWSYRPAFVKSALERRLRAAALTTFTVKLGVIRLSFAKPQRHRLSGFRNTDRNLRPFAPEARCASLIETHGVRWSTKIVGFSDQLSC